MAGTRTLDYFAGSVHDYNSIVGFLDYYGIGVIPTGGGKGRWRSCSANAERNVFLCADNQRREAKETFYLEVTGTGMRVLEQSEKFTGWQDAVKRFLDSGGVVKRIDAAIDDQEGRISMATVKEAVKEGNVIRKGNSWSLHEKHSRKGVGETLYVGSRESTVCQRVYNKGIQMGEGRDWLRFEFELKQEKADAWARVFVEEGWDVAYAALRGFMDFREPTEDKNRGRWPVAEWWRELVADSRWVLTVGKDVVASIERTMGQLRSQYGKTFVKLTLAFGGAFDWAYDVLEEGKKKSLSKADLRRIELYHKACEERQQEANWGSHRWDPAFA